MKNYIKGLFIAAIVLICLLVLSILLSKIPIFFNLFNSKKTINILLIGNHNGYMMKKLYHNGVSLWTYYVLYEFIKKFFLKKNIRLYFKSVYPKMKVIKLIRFIKKNQINYIIPTESSNAIYLSTHKQRLLKYVNMLVCDNPQIIKTLDDKYECYKFCKQYNIDTADTILIKKRIITPKITEFIEKHKFPLYLKKTFDSNGAQDVIKIMSVDELESKLCKIKSKWILQAPLESNHASIDVLFNRGVAISITIHSHKCHEDMRSVCNNFFYPNINSMQTHISVPEKYIDDIVDVVKNVGIYSNYTGILNIDMLIHNHKPYLLEINTRFSGSIYISLGTNLLKDYFKILMGRKINEHNIPHINYKSEQIKKASDVKNYSIVPFAVEHLGVILSIDNMNINTYASSE